MRSRLCRLSIRFGGLVVALTAIIGFIKSAALENDGGANANLAPYLARFATGTDAVGLGHDRLELLVFLGASVADVFVGWHGVRKFLAQIARVGASFNHAAG